MISALDCSNLPDGPNPHPSDCQKYIICHNHVLVEVKQCNHSDHFHPEYKFCVPASEYPCHQGSYSLVVYNLISLFVFCCVFVCYINVHYIKVLVSP